MLKNLTIEGGLQEDHLDFLWNLTEKARKHPKIISLNLGWADSRDCCLL